MYRLILYNVIYVVVVAVWITVNCLKVNKREEGAETKKSLKRAKATPITYETDPAVLEQERRQKIAENREKMRKKREKKTMKIEEAKEAQKKIKEKEMLSEDSTQPMNSDESIEQSKPSEEVLEPEKVGKIEPKKPVVPEKQEKTAIPKPQEEKSKVKTSNSGSNSTEEELGEVKLIDEDPYAAAKKHIIKKRAQELARKKQQEEFVRKRLDRENCAYLASPDDTLKNISSIQFESQLSVIQRKKRQSCSKDNTNSGESQDGTYVEAKSNELYIQDIPERVMQ